MILLQFPKIAKSAEIVELREIDDDCLGDVLGYFCEGHWDAKSFAIACNQEFDLAAAETPMHVHEVKHGYGLKIPIGDGETWEFHTYSKPVENSFPCTYAYF